MLIPYSTDAPIYHYPIATVSFIVINVLCFFMFCVGLSDSDGIDYFLDKDGNRLDKFEVMEQAGDLEANGQDARQFLQELRPIMGGGSDWRTELLLHYGRGLRPWQWLSCIFMHADIMHLIGTTSLSLVLWVVVRRQTGVVVVFSGLSWNRCIPIVCRADAYVFPVGCFSWSIRGYLFNARVGRYFRTA